MGHRQIFNILKTRVSNQRSDDGHVPKKKTVWGRVSHRELRQLCGFFYVGRRNCTLVSGTISSLEPRNIPLESYSMHAPPSTKTFHRNANHPPLNIPDASSAPEDP